MKFKVMAKAGAAAWHVKEFESEQEARAYANQCYKQFYNTIEIYAKDRTGYHLVTGHWEPWKAASERWAKQAAEEAPNFM